jgi:putative iron-only hydrogenase system regulator
MKLGFVGIIIEGDRSVASSVQAILSEYADLIVGRMGLPSLANNVCMITVGVKGPQEKISALSGKLGRLKGVKVKSAVSDIDVE